MGFEQIINSVPTLTAVATLIAAVIAATVTVVVALVNGWFSRRMAIDAAHRSYRSEVADAALSLARKAVADIYHLNDTYLGPDPLAWKQLALDITDAKDNLETDRRTPGDAVLAEAITVFRRRRLQLHAWLALATLRHEAGIGMAEARDYISEAAAVVEMAAEGYVFGVRGPRRRAKRLLKNLDPRPLNTRIKEVEAEFFGAPSSAPADPVAAF